MPGVCFGCAAVLRRLCESPEPEYDLLAVGFAGSEQRRREFWVVDGVGVVLTFDRHAVVVVVTAFQPFSVGAEVLARPAVWGNLLFLGVVASMLCYILWNAAMHRLGAVRTTNYIYFNPLVTIVTAALCIGERITAAALAGAALILYGMWRAERRPASGNKIPRPDVP